jgi:membrane protease YdiL (CAAX protease family)
MTQILSGLLVLVTVAVVIGSVIRGRTLAQRVEARPDGRLRLYRNFVLRMWPLMALPLVTVATTDRITARDVGWAWPHGVTGYLLTGCYMLIGVIASLRVRRMMRRGLVIAQRQRIAFMMPRTTRERWWTAALAVTAGAVEETIFRGSLLAVGTNVYHLPTIVVAGAALVLFAASHLYQGWRGLIGSALVGYIFTVIFLTSGSLLLAIVAHIAHDLLSMLLIPAKSSPKRTEEPNPAKAPPALSTPEPAEARPTPEPAASLLPPTLTVRAAAPE